MSPFFASIWRLVAQASAKLPAEGDEPEIHGDVPHLDPEMLGPAAERHGFESISYLLRRQAS